MIKFSCEREIFRVYIIFLKKFQKAIAKSIKMGYTTERYHESGLQNPLSIADMAFFTEKLSKMPKVRNFMAQNQKGVVAVVKALAEPLADEFGYILWDVEFVKEGAQRILRITIDSEEGITVDDCEKMHRAIDPVLDEADPIEEAYYLEVSSPGIERELKTDMHIGYCVGADVEVKLYAPRDGSKVFRGELLPLDENGNIVILCGENEIVFERATVAKLKTVYEF